MKARRPVFFNLTQIQMPVGAVTSFTHRVTGVLLALGVPCLLYLLQLSLRGPDGYAAAAGVLRRPDSRILAVLFIWALAHHLLAGVRHLLSDIDIGSRLHAARTSAWVVNGSAVAIALFSAGVLW